MYRTEEHDLRGLEQSGHEAEILAFPGPTADRSRWFSDEPEEPYGGPADHGRPLDRP